MKSIRILILPVIVGLLLLLAARPATAQGDLLFTLDSIIQGGAPGSEVLFTGTLANTSAAPLYLNGIAFNFDSLAAPYLTGDANVFNANVPFSLAASGSAGDAYSGPIFGVNIDPSTPTGAYTGSVTLLGGSDGNATDVLGTQNFEVVASTAAVPEADALLDMCLCLVLMGVAEHGLRRTHRAKW